MHGILIDDDPDQKCFAILLMDNGKMAQRFRLGQIKMPFEAEFVVLIHQLLCLRHVSLAVKPIQTMQAAPI